MQGYYPRTTTFPLFSQVVHAHFYRLRLVIYHYSNVKTPLFSIFFSSVASAPHQLPQSGTNANIHLLHSSAGASISSKPSLADIANGLMEAGIIFQVITLLIFGGLAVEFYFRCRKDNSSKSRSDIRTPDSTSSLRQDDTSEKPLLDRRLKLSLIAVVIAYFAILIRCIYRIAEMVGGWRNPIMQDQVLFVVLDGIMCIIACLVLNAFHPGAIFEKSKQVMLNGGIDDGGVVADTGAVDMEMAPIKMGEQGAK